MIIQITIGSFVCANGLDWKSRYWFLSVPMFGSWYQCWFSASFGAVLFPWGTVLPLLNYHGCFIVAFLLYKSIKYPAVSKWVSTTQICFNIDRIVLHHRLQTAVFSELIFTGTLYYEELVSICSETVRHTHRLNWWFTLITITLIFNYIDIDHDWH